jgi:hypothetical protein
MVKPRGIWTSNISEMSQSTFYRLKKAGFFTMDLKKNLKRINKDQILPSIESNNLIEENETVVYDTNIENETVVYDNNIENEFINLRDSYGDFECEEENEDIELDTNIIDSLKNNKDISEVEMVAIILIAFYKSKVSKDGLSTFIKAFNLLLNLKLPTTFDGLINILLKNENENIKNHKAKRWYCSRCKSFRQINNHTDRECFECKDTLLMYYNFDVEPQLKRIFSRINEGDLINSNNLNDDNRINDFYDGEFYKRLQSEDETFKNKESLTLMLNTDGISQSFTSEKTIWPIILIINELTNKRRFSLENVIIAGLSVGNSKPDFKTFLIPIIADITSLELGVELKFKNEEKVRKKFFLINSVFDKPARAGILNMKMCNSYDGCLKCYQSSQPAEDNHHIRIYKFNREFNQVRTPESYLSDLNEIKELRRQDLSIEDYRGVKGDCILNKAKHFNPVSSTCIDYMHSVLYGVGLNLLKYWFEKPCSNNYSFSNFKAIIDIRLKLIRPPSFVPAKPKSIYSINKWKAHDILVFFLYYALPVFTSIMPVPYLNNLTKFVISLEILLERVVKKDELVYAQILIEDFVNELENLYDQHILQSGVHELLHLVDCTKNFGPLNLINCFQFEDINGHVSRSIKGKDLIGEEFYNNFSIAQILMSFIHSQNTESVVYSFYEANKIFRSCNLKKDIINANYKPLTKILKCHEASLINIWNNFKNTNYEFIEIYEKFSYKENIYTSYLSENSRGDFCFRNNRNQFGLIRCFILDEEKQLFIIAKKLSVLYSPYSSHLYGNASISSRISCVQEIDEFFIEKIENIEKISLIKFSESSYYVSTFKMSHLFI